MTIIHLPESMPNTTPSQIILTTEEVTELLEQMFIAGENLAPDRFKQVIDYLLTGETEAVLEQLKFSDLKFKESGCQTMYNQIFDVLDAQQILRLSQLVTIVVKETRIINRYLDDTCAPENMKGLIYHALRDTAYERNGTMNRDNWTFRRMVDTFKSADDTDHNVEQSIIDLFLRRYIITNPSDGSDFLSEHAYIVNNILKTMLTPDITSFLEDTILAYPDYFKKQPDTLALLTVNNDKKIRKLALRHISTVPTEVIQQSLKKSLKTSTVKTSPWAIDALIATGDDYLSILEEVVTELDNQSKPNSKKVSDVIKKRLRFFNIDTQDVYLIPEFQPLQLTQIPDSFIEIMKQNAHEIYEQKKQALDQLIADDAPSYAISRAETGYKSWAPILENIDTWCQKMLDELNGKLRNIRFKEIATHNDSVQQLEEYGLLQAFVLSDLSSSYYWHSVAKYITPKLLEDIELRHFLQILSSVESHTNKIDNRQGNKRDNKRDIASDYLEKDPYRENTVPFSEPDRVVPFFMTYPELIAEALGIEPAKPRYDFELVKALEVLALFPQIPEAYIPKLLEVALGQQKTLRFETQEVLSKVPNIHLQAINALTDKTLDVRITAINWLGRLGQSNPSYRPEIIDALHLLMKKEKEEAVIAAVLSALEQNKDDISVFLTADALLGDAEKGLNTKLSETFEWFDFDALPDVYWQNGDKVDRQIIRWWTVLAEKLKTPKPNQLLQRYMSLLGDSSQKRAVTLYFTSVY